MLRLANGSLSHSLDRQDPGADATLAMARSTFDDVILGTASVVDLVAAGTAQLSGDADVLFELLELLDTFDLWFNIVEP